MRDCAASAVSASGLTWKISRRLILGSGVMTLGSCDQGYDGGSEEGLATFSRVVNELEEAGAGDSLSRGVPRCGRSQDRNKDQTPSRVLTWTS